MNKLILVGNDKIGCRLISRLEGRNDIVFAFDVSTDCRRLWKLVRRSAITLEMLIKMSMAELFRKNCRTKKYPEINNNYALLDMIRKHHIDQVYLFRVGLMINEAVIRSGVEVLNMHCARIPEYKGLGAILKALRDCNYAQEATLHRVVEQIDSGETIAIQPYFLDKKASYQQNEDRAYEAGIQLILDHVG